MLNGVHDNWDCPARSLLPGLVFLGCLRNCLAVGSHDELRGELAIEERRPAPEAVRRPVLRLGAPVLTEAVRDDFVHFLGGYRNIKNGKWRVSKRG